MPFEKADRVYIGKSIYDLQSALGTVNASHKHYSSLVTYEDLRGLRVEAFGYEQGIIYFHNVFCPTHNLTSKDIESFIEEYKSLNVPDYFEVRGKETLTQKDLFGRSEF